MYYTHSGDIPEECCTGCTHCTVRSCTLLPSADRPQHQPPLPGDHAGPVAGQPGGGEQWGQQGPPDQRGPLHQDRPGAQRHQHPARALLVTRNIFTPSN